jgi:hypothetical protein
MHWQHVPLGAAVASTVWLLVQHFRGSDGKSPTRTRQVGLGVPCFWLPVKGSCSSNALICAHRLAISSLLSAQALEPLQLSSSIEGAALRSPSSTAHTHTKQ